MQCIGFKVWKLRILPYSKDFSNAGKVEKFENSDVEPPDIKFKPLVREFCGVRIFVVIVVELLPTNEDSDRHDVGAIIRTFFGTAIKIPISVAMSDAVDDSGSKKRNPGHLHRPYRNTDCAK